jgi:hypothetical protein
MPTNEVTSGKSFAKAAASCGRSIAAACSLVFLCGLVPAYAGIPEGACCLPDATCSRLTEMQCEQADGTLIGLGVSCEAVSCEMASVPIFSAAFLAVAATLLVAAGIFKLQRRRAD